MKRSDIVYNPALDLEPVDQFGFVDVRAAYDKGVVDGNISIEQSSFNGVDDPSTIMDRPRDTFESYRQADFVKRAVSAAKANAAAATTGE